MYNIPTRSHKYGALYQHLAAAVHAHAGNQDDLVAAICEVVSDEVDAAVRDQLDETLHRIDVPVEPPELPEPAPEGRHGYTEAEAAQRWCPFAREATPVGKSKKDAAIGNRYTTTKDDFTNPAGCRCIASHCMSWRWESEATGHCGLSGPIGYMPADEPRRLANRVPPSRDPTPDLFADVADSRHGAVSSPTQAACKGTSK